MWRFILIRLHVNPVNVAVVGGLTLAALATCVFAWRNGERGDRLTALVFGLCWIGSIASIWTSAIIVDDLRPPLVFGLVWDFLPAAAFLYVSVRDHNLWFGAATAAQGLQLAIRGLDILLHEPIGTPVPLSLGFGVNLLNLVMMAAMIGSALSARARRRVVGANQAA